MSDDDDRICVEERAAELGLMYDEERELERRHPFVKHWSSRWGNGAVNMRAWLVADRAAGDVGRLCIVGPPGMVRIITGIVERLPAPVRFHIIQHVRIACTLPGLGITGPAPLPPPGGELTSIVLPWTDLGMVAHEISHSWQRDPSLFAELSAAQIEILDEMVAERLGAADSDDRTPQSELAADAMASQLIGRRVDTSGPRGLRLSARDAENIIVGGKP